MAVTRYTIDGKGQIELNNVAFRRDGRIEAQCALTADAENGMVLAIDKAHGTCTPSVDGKEVVCGINYSTEHLYDERKPGLKEFSLKEGEYPRIGLPAVGDLFTTNTFGFDTSVFANLEAVRTQLKSGVAYAGVDNGIWNLVKVKPEGGLTARVVAVTTMPDGQDAVKLQIIAC